MAVAEAQQQQRAVAGEARRELAKVQAQIAKLIQAIKDGIPASVVRAELEALDRRRLTLDRVNEHRRPLPRSVPDLSAIYRRQLTKLRAVLADDGADPAARSAVRDLVETIVLEPNDTAWTFG